MDHLFHFFMPGTPENTALMQIVLSGSHNLSMIAAMAIDSLKVFR